MNNIKKAKATIDVENESFIKTLKEGDTEAFSDLFQVIAPSLSIFLENKFGLNEADAEEIAVDTMIKVRSSIAKFQLGKAKIKTWIFKIGIHTAIDFVRGQKKLSQKLSIAELNNSTKQIANKELTKDWFNKKPIDEKNINSDLSKVSKALQSLSEKDQDILRLRCCLEYEDISKIENTEINALRTRHSRAMTRLRQKINKEENL